MSQGAPQPPAEEPLAPPDERFWQKYSAHHEFPLSSLASVLAHLFILGLVLLIVFNVFNFGRDTDPPPIEAVALVPGPDNTAGGGGASGLKDDIPDQQQPRQSTQPPQPLPDLPPVPLKAEDLPVELREANFDKVVEQNANVAKSLARLDSKLKLQLMSGLAKAGGEGKGEGTGKGDSSGPGTGQKTARRALRWDVFIDARVGREYLEKLRVLGAILAVSPSPGKAVVYRNLDRIPLRGSLEDLSTIKRLFFIDDDRQSMHDMAAAMGLTFVPNQLIVFFPKSFEDELARKERAFQGRNEDDIARTRFRVSFSGTSYTVTVTGQDAK